MFTIRMSSSILTLSAAFGVSASVCADNGYRVAR
jgi:hypothetical protein